jgi:hypothetical protein
MFLNILSELSSQRIIGTWRGNVTHGACTLVEPHVYMSVKIPVLYCGCNTILAFACLDPTRIRLIAVVCQIDCMCNWESLDIDAQTRSWRPLLLRKVVSQWSDHWPLQPKSNLLFILSDKEGLVLVSALHWRWSWAGVNSCRFLGIDCRCQCLFGYLIHGEYHCRRSCQVISPDEKIKSRRQNLRHYA